VTVPLFWLLLAIVAVIVELLSPLFGFVFASVAALAAAAGAGIGLSLTMQVVVFVATLLVTLALIRPKIVSKLGARGVPSRTEVLIGRAGRVTEAIDPIAGSGRILVAGEDWAASSELDLPPGTTVRVTGADGIMLQVVPAHSDSESGTH
jgi:membrane protein implicated in regulation of membrane protease activity